MQALVGYDDDQQRLGQYSTEELLGELAARVKKPEDLASIHLGIDDRTQRLFGGIDELVRSVWGLNKTPNPADIINLNDAATPAHGAPSADACTEPAPIVNEMPLV